MAASIPLAARRELWAWRYAQRSFEHCWHCCDFVLKERMDSDHPLYYSLTLAVHVNYSRPFKNSHGLAKLPELILPANKRELHKQIVAARDKLYTHVDADGDVTWDSEPAVDVRISFEPRGVVTKCLEVTTMPAGFLEIGNLAATLEEKCVYHMRKIVKRYRKSFPKGLGEFSICVGKEGPEFIRVEPA